MIIILLFINKFNLGFCKSNKTNIWR